MAPATVATAIVVPFFNEADRLRPDGLVALLARPGLTLHLVDDGSTDGTAALLTAMATEHPDRIRVLTLARNTGKGEAVRRGLQQAAHDGAAIVGYFDADLATSTADLLALVDAATANPNLAAVLGSRVALLGHRVERARHRHYVGRVFATASSIVLGLTVYDTQCGAKVLRNDERLVAALREPFASRWAFDVELLGRLSRGTAATPAVRAEELLEVPVWDWRDVAGSRLRLRASLRAAADLWTIRRRLGTWR